MAYLLPVSIIDLGINVSSDCSFDFHISNLVKRIKHLTGWILRTFSSRTKLTILTLLRPLLCPTSTMVASCGPQT